MLVQTLTDIKKKKCWITTNMLATYCQLDDNSCSTLANLFTACFMRFSLKKRYHICIFIARGHSSTFSLLSAALHCFLVSLKDFLS